jgi:hypothetical protein
MRQGFPIPPVDDTVHDGGDISKQLRLDPIDYRASFSLGNSSL